ncbi:programmed cell death protein 2 [Toxorhynchites rutilus septentrionalis]|uniref:programmed cell death protein 2 n=1 Tax=Toxorhynchites rutilus septentrionalis TaxID=329112 RepID=UPI00247A0D3B|nr:programmed cell death protein 2 [Toxorhynchites rutilus septentrionalis]
MCSSVDLGFIESIEPWLLYSNYFPSKVGGTPSWLELGNIPCAKDLLCDSCNEPCSFLCQVYAPLEEKPNCFHRTLFVFVCLNASCYEPNQNRNIKVFRSQLPLRNAYYDCNPPNEEEPADPIKSSVPLCVVCGCRGQQLCSKCKKANYCGVVHQRIDWKNGHKTQCGTSEETTPASFIGSVLFPESGIVIEPEEMDSQEKLSEEEKEKKQMQEYTKMVEERNIGELSELSENEFDQYSEQVEDKHFAEFKKRTANEPQQILRYHRGGVPLWLSPKIPEEIPPCEECGSRRVFEFQIMPQLLNHLKNDNIDWGTLAIYSCEQSCDSTTRSYMREFVYKQDVINTDQS